MPMSQRTPNILVVDDTPANLQLLAGTLKEWGYKARPAPSGRLALQAAKNALPDVILLDINMPEMDGYEVCRRLKADAALRDVPVIFLSAAQEMSDKVQAFEAGGVDYVTKPFHLAELHARIAAHLKICSLTAALNQQNQQLHELVSAQVHEILAAKEALSQAHLATIVALSKLAEARDDDTGQHIERTRAFCRLLAEQLRHQPDLAGAIDDEFMTYVFHAAPLHDIGKVAIPDSILLKPGRLTAEEFEVMKTHTTIGAQTLLEVLGRHANNKFIATGAEIAYAHHEKWDGSGYPRGLKGAEIPLSARIMAVADVYDALTSDRVYKRAFSHEDSRRIILEGRGSAFDPKVVEAFATTEEKFYAIRQALRDGPQPAAESGAAGANDLGPELQLLGEVKDIAALAACGPECGAGTSGPRWTLPLEVGDFQV